MKKKVILLSTVLGGKSMAIDLSKDYEITFIDINPEALLEFGKCIPCSKMG